MALVHSPRIVTDGIALALDAGNSKSWNVGISSDWTDRVGGNNGTLVNGTFHNDGPFAGAGYVEFDGSGDYLTVPASSDFSFDGDFTIECFINTSVISLDSYYRRIISTGDDNAAAIQLLFFNGTDASSNISVRSNLQLINGDIGAATGKWVHVAVTRSGSSLKLFIDGVQSGGTATTSTNFTDGATHGVTIGRYATVTAGHFEGFISNVRIIKGTALYTSNFTVPTKSLTAITNTSLLTCQGNTITDASSSAHTITASGDITLTKEPFTGAGAVEFDGTGDYLSVPQSTDFQFSSSAIDFTIEAHVYGSAFSGAFTTIAAVWGGGGSEAQWLLSVNASGVLGFAWNPYSNGANFISGGTLSTNTWHHVAVTRSGNTFRLFVDGAETASGTNSGTNSNNTQLSIGRYAIGYAYDSSEWEGYISNVRVIKGTALYTSAFTPPTRKLDPIENTALLTCQGQNIKDYSSSAHAITVNGDPKPTIVSSAFDFDGTDDYVTISDSEDLEFGSGDFTIEAYIYPTGVPSGSGYACIFAKGSPLQCYFMNTNSLSLFVDGDNNGSPYSIIGNTNITGNNTVNQDEWTHIAICRSGDTWKVFTGGVQKYSATHSGTIFNNTDVFSIGDYASSSGIYPFQGYISNLKVYKGKGLTAAEVLQNYNALKGRYV